MARTTKSTKSGNRKSSVRPTARKARTVARIQMPTFTRHLMLQCESKAMAPRIVDAMLKQPGWTIESIVRQAHARGWTRKGNKARRQSVAWVLAECVKRGANIDQIVHRVSR